MKSPAVQFALLGLGLFIVFRLFFSGDPGDPGDQAHDTRIVVPAWKVAALLEKYEANNRMAATPAMRTELIDQFAEEEMLYRESRRWGLTSNNQAIDLRLRQKMEFVGEEGHGDGDLAERAKELGLDSDDAVVRNMLAHNMRLLLARRGELEPTDEEVEAYYERESSRFARPARLTGWHVFFSSDVRGSEAHAAASAAKATLNSEPLEPGEAVKLGDVSPSGAHFKGQLARQLALRFGEAFAKVAERVPDGQWSDPVDTPFGAHLILIEERTTPQAPPLTEIRARVTATYQSNQRQKRLAAAMDELRTRYEVVVEAP